VRKRVCVRERKSKKERGGGWAGREIKREGGRAGGRERKRGMVAVRFKSAGREGCSDRECVCVCVREREIERERGGWGL
jgi:hypothetical protein